MSKTVCIIPARSGSKRIKNKNLVNINGIPLIKYVCKNIIKSKEIDDYYVATDSSKIYKAIGYLKKTIKLYKRSKKNSLAKSKSEDVLMEFLKKYQEYNVVVFLQVTNPFINYRDLDRAIVQFLNKKYDSMLSVTKSKNFLWKKNFFTKPLNYNYKKRKMSQKINEYYVENGSFYIFYRKNLLKFKNRLHKKIGVYTMSKKTNVEIDDQEDLEIVRKLLK